MTDTPTDTPAETTTPQPAAYAAYIGLDWADQKHQFSLQEAGASQIERGELEHRPETVQAWAVALAQRFGARPVLIALEQRRGALVFMLTQYAHLRLLPVPTTAVQGLRQAFRPSGATDDPYDADILLELARDHRHKFAEFQPDTPLTRQRQHAHCCHWQLCYGPMTVEPCRAKANPLHPRRSCFAPA